MAEALGPGLADAGVLVLLLDDVGPSLGLDPGQGEPLAEDLRQLVEGQLDLEDVVPGGLAGAAGRRRRLARAADRGADVARPLPDAAAALGPVAELGDVDLRQGDRDQLAPGLADHLAVRDVLPQVGLDLAADDLLEPIGIALDFTHHGRCSPRRWGTVEPAVAAGRAASTTPHCPDARTPGPPGRGFGCAAAAPPRVRLAFEMAKIRSGLAMERNRQAGAKLGWSSARPARFHCERPASSLSKFYTGARSNYSSRSAEKAGSAGITATAAAGLPAVAAIPARLFGAQWLPRLTSPRAKMLAT